MGPISSSHWCSTSQSSREVGPQRLPTSPSTRNPHLASMETHKAGVRGGWATAPEALAILDALLVLVTFACEALDELHRRGRWGIETWIRRLGKLFRESDLLVRQKEEVLAHELEILGG